MDARITFRECLAKASPDVVCVQGCIGMYRACGEDAPRSAVLEWAARGDCAADGRAMIFAWQETEDEQYRQAAVALAGRTGMDGLALADAYRVLPFLMAYEMKLNRMENVGGLTRRICSLHKAMWHADEGALDAEHARYILALADAVEECSEQLYEHWRALADLYRGTVKDVLPKLDEAEANAVLTAACGLLKGVRMGLIDGERYLPLALRLLEKTDAAALDEAGLGVMMQACAELLRIGC